MSFQDKLYELANRLLAGTIQGTIKWTETADENSFRAVLHTGLVRIERAPGSELVPSGSYSSSALVPSSSYSGHAFPAVDEFDYHLLVLDEKNKEIGRYIPDVPERAMTLRNLWELACRAALNADQKIDHLLQEVDSKLAKK